MKLEIEFEPMPEQVAEWFVNQNSEKQAECFKLIANKMWSWTRPAAAIMQCYYIVKELENNEDATNLLEEISSCMRHKIDIAFDYQI